MEVAHTLAQATQTDRSHDSERKCLVTGDVLPKDDLIRFVVGPDQLIVPDLAQNLPGRGLWVTADAEILQRAIEKNLFSKAAKTKVYVANDLASLVVSLLRKRCLDFIGLARRAGIAVLGQPQVEVALKGRKLDLLLLANDASQALDSRLIVTTYTFFTRDELGASFGHDQIVYAGLMAHALTQKLKVELLRLSKVASIITSSAGNGNTHQ